MKAICLLFGMLAATLFLSSESLSAPADKDEAKELFDRMEKKLAEADTIELNVQCSLGVGDQAGTVKATLWTAQGNKARMAMTMKGGGKTRDVTMVSDGTKQKSGSPSTEFKETDTPKLLHDNLVYSLSRIGFTPNFMETKERDDSKGRKDLVVVSDFKLDKRDEIDDKEVYVLHYQFAFADEDKKFETTLYIDTKTLLPVRRTVPAYGNLKEDYQYRLDEKIADDKFELPK